MNASIINIGDELLIGQVVNTNATAISRMLTANGIGVAQVLTIADSRDAILQALNSTLAASDTVIITGGLGPTKDDITKHTLCQYFHSTLVENPVALDNVRRIFAQRGYELTPINRQQAWVPACCTMLNNLLGTAPGMWFEHGEKVVVSLPGVPFEMVGLMESEVLPRLQQHFHIDHIINKNLLVHGIGESFLSDLIEPWELSLPESIRLAYLPQAGLVKLRLTARGTDEALLRQQIAEALQGLYPLAGEYILGEDFETLPELVAHRMRTAGKTLATAESCTGGSIASRLTALPGASDYYRGGIVAYSNEVKECALGVSHATLEAHGAVSEATVREMVEGVRQRLGADYAIATTGIAGPTGGTPTKPVGTVWIGLATPTATTALCCHYGNDRLRTIERTVNQAYALLIKSLKS